jgi:hypothetical protein
MSTLVNQCKTAHGHSTDRIIVRCTFLLFLLSIKNLTRNRRDLMHTGQKAPLENYDLKLQKNLQE